MSEDAVPQPADVGEAMLRVMEVVDSTSELRPVLYRLVEVTLEVTGAERSAILLVEDGRLEPTAVAARRPNEELFRRFRTMEPISMERVADRRRVVEGDDVVTVPDAARSSLVPDEWVEALGTRSAAIVPLVIDDEPRGVIAVDYQEPHAFGPDELNLLRAVAHAARIALGRADLHAEEARRRLIGRKLLDAMTAVSSRDELRDVFGALASSVASLFSASRCTIRTADGTSEVVRGDAGDGAEETVFPLWAGETLHGHLVLRADASALGPEDLALLEAFARQAGLACERARLTESLRGRSATMEAIGRLPGLLAELDSLDADGLGRLNEFACRPAGVLCMEVALDDGALARALGCRTLGSEERNLSARLASERPGALEEVGDDRYAVGVASEEGFHGLLWARVLEPPLVEGEAELLGSVARGLAGVVERARLARDLHEAIAEAERAEELGGLHRELDRTLDRTLHGLARGFADVLTRRRHAPEMATELRRMQGLVTSALTEAHRVAASEAVLDVRDDGLEVGLRSLCRAFSEESGISTTLRVEGDAGELARPTEEALYAIAFEALQVLERSGRATGVVVTLSPGDPVVLAVRDDGAGLAQRDEDAAPGVHYALGAIRERAELAGGSMSLEPAHPRGMRLEARLPARTFPGAEIRQVVDPDGRETSASRPARRGEDA